MWFLSLPLQEYMVTDIAVCLCLWGVLSLKPYSFPKYCAWIFTPEYAYLQVQAFIHPDAFISVPAPLQAKVCLDAKETTRQVQAY